MGLDLVKNNYAFWEFIRCLRNMEAVRQGFIEQKEIYPEQHERFMKSYSDCFYICLVDKEPAGYVGVIDDDIRVAVHPDFQGKGVGTFMVNGLMEMHETAYAKIKLENTASIKLFEKCNFTKRYYILEKNET
jgi:RimJ/RimL family protein N-acetyltransferase